jgi:hypothetical protein
MTPHPAPAIWTVDASARSTAARADASVGRLTGAAVWGGSPEKTTGKPFWARNRSTPANTVGMGGSTSSRARTMRDCCSERSSAAYWLFCSRTATTHVTMSATTTATATPNTESAGPRRSRCSTRPERAPSNRPRPLTMVATPTSAIRVTTVLAVVPSTSRATDGARRAPR